MDQCGNEREKEKEKKRVSPKCLIERLELVHILISIPNIQLNNLPNVFH